MADILIPVLNTDDCLVCDEQDADLLAQYNWRLANDERRIFARISQPRKTTISPNRLVMGVPAGDPRYVYYEDGDNFNLRRSNLYIATLDEWKAKQREKQLEQQKANRVFRGVRSCKRWEAHITINGQRVSLGTFETPEEAAHAYDKAAQEAYGESAYQNFPK